MHFENCQTPIISDGDKAIWISETNKMSTMFMVVDFLISKKLLISYYSHQFEIKIKFSVILMFR